MILATQTMDAIERSLASDDCNVYRGHLKHLLPKMDDAYRQDDAPFRAHLGGSLMGRECGRELWYGFRWVMKKKFGPRMLRLFNRGHLEEAHFIAMLMCINCRVYFEDEKGKQLRIKAYKGHGGGSLDSVIKGIPEMPEEPVLGEYKTHGEKSFNKLKKHGVTKSKWEHFVQMQLYMGYYKLRYALYMAVNKNTDELHCEIVEFDPDQCARYNERFKHIIDANEPPRRLSDNPSWYQCKYCDFQDVCHRGKPVLENCRTCQFVEFRESAEVYCTYTAASLPEELQLIGCGYYVKNSEL